MIRAMYTPTRTIVEVVQDGEERAYVRFPATGQVLWVKSDLLDFDDLDIVGRDQMEIDELDDLDSPTDFDEYEMNPDDCAPDAADQYDFEYDR